LWTCGTVAWISRIANVAWISESISSSQGCDGGFSRRYSGERHVSAQRCTVAGIRSLAYLQRSSVVTKVKGADACVMVLTANKTCWHAAMTSADSVTGLYKRKTENYRSTSFKRKRKTDTTGRLRSTSNLSRG